MPLSRHDLIFKQWENSLAGRDKSWDSVGPNFEELFESLKQSGLESANAYEYLPKAIKAHSPAASLVKFQYKKTKVINPRIGTEKEFEEGWVAGITKKATDVFFETFPQEIVKPVARPPVPQKEIDSALLEFEAEDDGLTLE
jgi:hypothetical protein